MLLRLDMAWRWPSSCVAAHLTTNSRLPHTSVPQLRKKRLNWRFVNRVIIRPSPNTSKQTEQSACPRTEWLSPSQLVPALIKPASAAQKSQTSPVTYKILPVGFMQSADPLPALVFGAIPTPQLRLFHARSCASSLSNCKLWGDRGSNNIGCYSLWGQTCLSIFSGMMMMMIIIIIFVIISNSNNHNQQPTAKSQQPATATTTTKTTTKTNRQTNKQTKKPRNQQTNKPTSQQATKPQTNKPTNQQINIQQTNKPTNQQTNKPTNKPNKPNKPTNQQTPQQQHQQHQQPTTNNQQPTTNNQQPTDNQQQQQQQQQHQQQQQPQPQPTTNNNNNQQQPTTTNNNQHLTNN